LEKFFDSNDVLANFWTLVEIHNPIADACVEMANDAFAFALEYLKRADGESGCYLAMSSQIS
jgi:hypothetical protein